MRDELRELIIMISEYFLPGLFFIFILFATGFAFLLTTPSLKNRVENISALISIAMSMLAIISSGASIYYIYDLLKYP